MRQHRFSRDNHSLTHLHSVRIVRVSDGAEVGTLPHTKTSEIVFSPLSTYIALWETFASMLWRGSIIYGCVLIASQLPI